MRPRFSPQRVLFFYTFAENPSTKTAPEAPRLTASRKRDVAPRDVDASRSTLYPLSLSTL